jgi:Cu+-exporting ATPase
MVGRGLAARLGILIKDGEVLEKANKIRAVIFDKTGTLTEGAPQVIETRISPLINLSEEALLKLAYSVQKNNSHPLARALTQKALTANVKAEEVIHSRIIPGKGSEAELKSGHIIQIGSLAWMLEQGYDTESLSKVYVKTLELGLSSAWIANASTKTILGYHSFADKIKTDAPKAIAQLSQMGLHTVLLTGDKKEVATHVGNKLGIESIIAEVQPKEKLSHLLRLREQFGAVAMVGDGINDGPALAAADLGIAMGEGTDVAIGASAITLMRSNPLQVVDSIIIARSTYRKIKQNLFWAFIYNAIGIPLACMGLLNPMIAAAAMAFSSVSVIGNSLILGLKSESLNFKKSKAKLA